MPIQSLELLLLSSPILCSPLLSPLLPSSPLLSAPLPLSLCQDIFGGQPHVAYRVHHLQAIQSRAVRDVRLPEASFQGRKEAADVLVALPTHPERPAD